MPKAFTLLSVPKRILLTLIVTLGVALLAVIMSWHRDRDVKFGDDWDLEGFVPSDRVFDKFVAAPAISPIRPDFGTERVTSEIRTESDGKKTMAWEISGHTHLEYGALADNPGPVETHAASDELVVGDARIRLVDIKLLSYRDSGRDALCYDTEGNLQEEDPNSPWKSWPKATGAISHIRLTFRITGGPVTMSDFHWKNLSDGAQGNCAHPAGDNINTRGNGMNILCTRCGSSSLQIGFAVSAPPWQTGSINFSDGADLRLGDFSLKAAAPHSWDSTQTVNGVSISRMVSGSGGGYGSAGNSAISGGISRLVTFSHREAPGRLMDVRSTSTPYDITSHIYHHEACLISCVTAADTEGVKVKRLSAAKRFIVNLPSMKIPAERKPPRDILDAKYADWGNLPGYAKIFKDNIRREFGIRLPDDYPPPINSYNPAHMPSLGAPNATLRQILVAYFKPAHDAGKIVRLDSKTGIFTIEDPWWKTARDWGKEKLVKAGIMEP